MRRYDDLLHLPHHVSKTRRPMPVEDRAAQFASFAALTGYGAAVDEAGRRTDRRCDLTEEEKELLDRQIGFLIGILPSQPQVTVTRFVPDERKEGGRYETFTGQVRRVDTAGRFLIFTDGTALPMDAVVRLEGAAFAPLFPGESYL